MPAHDSFRLRGPGRPCPNSRPTTIIRFSTEEVKCFNRRFLHECRPRVTRWERSSSRGPTPYTSDGRPVLSDATAVGILIVPILLIIGHRYALAARTQISRKLRDDVPAWSRHERDRRFRRSCSIKCRTWYLFRDCSPSRQIDAVASPVRGRKASWHQAFYLCQAVQEV